MPPPSEAAPRPGAAGEQLLAELRAQEPAMLACLREWVEIESPSQAPERVRALAQKVARAFEATGCEARLHPTALELRRPGRTDAPLLLLGHLDTVYPLGTLAQMPFEVAGDRVHGPGVFDMKAGVVQALFALQALGRELGGAAPRPLRLVFDFDEEIGSQASRGLIEELCRGAAAALVLEPAAGEPGQLKIARKGIARYSLRARGVAAHSGLDFERGASAVVELAGQIVELARWSNAERGVTVNTGLMTGGTGVNVVAPEASAEVEARAWTATELKQVDHGVRALRARDPRVRIEVSGGISRPPMEASAAALALMERAKELGREVGLQLEATRVGGASDGNLTAALGVATLDGLGAVGAGAHSPDEHINLTMLAPRTALLTRLLATL